MRRAHLWSMLVMLLVGVSGTTVHGEEDEAVLPPIPATDEADTKAADSEAEKEDAKTDQPQEESIVPPPEIVVPDADSAAADDEPSERGERRLGEGLPGRINVRAPYTDVRVEGGDRPGVSVWTPWADVRVDSRSGVRVNTPVGPVHIGADSDVGRRFFNSLPQRESGSAPAARSDRKAVLGVFLRDDDGIRVSSVQNGSPAAEANLAVGDRIVSMNGYVYPNADALKRDLAGMRAGDLVRLTVARNGDLYRADVRLKAYEEVFAEPQARRGQF